MTISIDVLTARTHFQSGPRRTRLPTLMLSGLNLGPMAPCAQPMSAASTTAIATRESFGLMIAGEVFSGTVRMLHAEPAVDGLAGAIADCSTSQSLQHDSEIVLVTDANRCAPASWLGPVKPQI